MSYLLVLVACLLREHSSLSAFWYLARNSGRMLEKRREIMKRKRVSDDYIASWFHYTPVSHPAPKPSVKALARAAARVRATTSTFASTVSPTASVPVCSTP